MATAFAAFTDEQRRVLVNLRQHHDVWIEARRALAALPYDMTWKTVSGRDYLYRIVDRKGNASSQGRRSPATEATYATFKATKAALQERLDRGGRTLAETAALYRALRLPLLPSPAAAILREADLRGLLGSRLLVVGTNAMVAYAIEAGGRLQGIPDETDDFDLTWSSRETPPEPHPVWTMLKAVDSTYTVNAERPFQARNAGAYEVELLAAPSTLPTLARRDHPRPAALPEQEWLLKGRPVDQVAVGRDGSPARLVVPDPRWFALQKLWLAAQEKRSALKRPKDEKQGRGLLDIVATALPHYPLDEDFAGALPEELAPHYARWNARRPAAPAGWRDW